MKVIKRTAILILAAALAGCGPLVELPGSGPAPAMFTLSPAPPAALEAARPLKLMIEEASGDALINSDRIAVRVGATEVRYLAAARWSDQPRRLFRDRLQALLDGIDGVTALTDNALEVPADYRLKLRLRAFNAVDSGGTLGVRVEVAALLLSGIGATVVADRSFVATGTAAGGDAAAVVAALDEAQAEVAAAVARWLLDAAA